MKKSGQSEDVRIKSYQINDQGGDLYMTHQGEVIALKGLMSFSTSHFDESGAAPRTLSQFYAQV